MTRDGQLPVQCRPGLRISWYRVGDRCGHQVEVEAAGRWHLLGRSLEGPAGSDWPESPPCQEVHIAGEELAAVLAVGQAGRSHWSLSVAFGGGSLPTAEWDVACRLRAPAGRLGATYVLPEDIQALHRPGEPGSVVLQRAGEPLARCRLVPQPSAAVAWEVTAGRLRLAVSPLAAPPAMVRWRYTLESLAAG